ncbi:MAG: NHL repeat-containing protein, partial [Armatimonadota bacterium]|nr:NHL repeat-containing protein [Armatimonadota bacterium]
EVRQLLPNGKLGMAIRLDGPPRAVGAAADGTVYVAMRDHVQVFSPRGDRRARWKPLGARSVLTALGIGAADVWVADAGERVVWRFGRGGEARGRIGARDEGRRVPGLVVPSPHLDVAVAPDGGVWVSNPGRHRVERYATDGQLLWAWGEAANGVEGFCGCCNPTDIAVLPEGGFVTSEKGIPRVKRYSAAGEFVGLVAGADAFTEGVTGLDLAADAAGRVLVLDPAARAVRVFVRK